MSLTSYTDPHRGANPGPVNPILPSQPEAKPHFGKCVLSPQEAAEHAAFEQWARLYHLCPQCSGFNQFERCPKCNRLGYWFPRAVAERLGLADVFYPQAERREVATAPPDLTPDFLAICLGPGEDVTPLEWASAFLTEIDGDNGVLGEAMERNDDPTAVYTAWEATCRLIRGLRAVCERRSSVAPGGEGVGHDD